MGRYHRPLALADALATLAGGPATVVAGGTDVFPARLGRPFAEDVLDITGITALKGIGLDGGWLRIGALATWSELAQAPLPPWLDGIRRAAREVGGVQIQNAGTVVGNLCNASPAADGVPSLLALDAEVELASSAGLRRIPVAEFVLGNRRTARRPEELATALLIPEPGPGARSSFEKLGARRYLVISIAMAAAVLEPAADGTVGRIRVAVGACGPVARRLPALEAALRGLPLGPDLAGTVTPAHLDGLSPIDDVRGTAEYRREAALVLVRRAIRTLTEQA
ncbi:FAD binding domain-containing protein [Arenibaculum pallidiluteum]|uniref:FAD binding domain-containing protein n=1 Tax=Arenibaculum pallidiluteum TaxID=2812559 RepID=UPI001A976BF9|nr:FAD binding domain-containing protein [Arenibaculum pallidiluteum]